MNWPRSLALAVVVALTFAVSHDAPKAAGNTASATGSGQVTINGDLRNFTFNARTDSSGVTTGETEAFNRDDGFRWHGTLNCLSVTGNRATMSGVVTDISPSSPPFDVGSPILFQVIDNGEGSNGTPDRISLTFFYGAGNPSPGCKGFSDFTSLNVERGNVQVH
jgi:hypothetical protein